MSESPLCSCGRTPSARYQRLAIAASVTALLLSLALVRQSRRAHQISVAAEMPAAAASVVAAVPVAMNDDDEEMKAARRAVTDVLREKYPQARIDGVFLLPLTRDGSAYFARADAAQGETRRPLPALACRYVRRNGTSYWRAESLGRDEAAARLEQADAAQMGL